MLSYIDDKEMYLLVKYLIADGEGQFTFELHSDLEGGNRHQTITMTSDDFLHVACTTSFGRQRNVETQPLEDGGIMVWDNFHDNAISLHWTVYDHLKKLSRYIMEDIDLMYPYIEKQDGIRLVEGRYVVQRLFLTYVRDLHEHSMYKCADQDRLKECTGDDMVIETFRSATIQGFRTFLSRCGLIINQDIKIDHIIGNLEEHGSGLSLIINGQPPPPTHRIFTHYIRCEKCSYK